MLCSSPELVNNKVIIECYYLHKIFHILLVCIVVPDIYRETIVLHSTILQMIHMRIKERSLFYSSTDCYVLGGTLSCVLSSTSMAKGDILTQYLNFRLLCTRPYCWQHNSRLLSEVTPLGCTKFRST
jgi:hypothetical protein